MFELRFPALRAGLLVTVSLESVRQEPDAHVGVEAVMVRHGTAVSQATSSLHSEERDLKMSIGASDRASCTDTGQNVFSNTPIPLITSLASLSPRMDKSHRHIQTTEISCTPQSRRTDSNILRLQVAVE